MRHPVRGLEKGLTPDVRLSDYHLNQHRLINALWTKVSERSEGVCLGRCSSVLLNPQNFANTIGKPTPQEVLHAMGLTMADLYVKTRLNITNNGHKSLVKVYDYYDAQGTLVLCHVKTIG
jgi:hypothetical protein